MLPIPNNAWHKPSRSAGANNCVEVAHTHGWTALRDSKNKTGPILIFTDDEWSTFIKDAVVRSAHPPTLSSAAIRATVENTKTLRPAAVAGTRQHAQHKKTHQHG
jgi:hypothetical protein